MMNYDSIIFDLDGTLWDTREEIYQIWCECIKKRNLPVPSKENFSEIFGLTPLAIMQKLFPNIIESEAMNLFHDCSSLENVFLYNNGAKNYDTMTETLSELSKSHKLFIVSNCQCNYIEAYLHSMGTAEFFSDHLCHGTFNLPKDENIRIIIERNNLKKPVYIGDTILDMQSAVSAKIPFIYASYGFGDFECEFEKITKPVELLEIV